MQKCLMLGSGHAKAVRKMRSIVSAPEDQTTWTTLDCNPYCYPDVVFDLDGIEHGNPLPFKNDYFDEIHAYSVMEHYGRQGDYRGFFTGMAELWRVLKPNGVLFGITPDSHSRWALGEPGHTRVLCMETFIFCVKSHYDQLGKTAASDYRKMVEPCWWLLDGEVRGEDFQFAMVKVVDAAS